MRGIHAELMLELTPPDHRHHAWYRLTSRHGPDNIREFVDL